MFRGELVNLTEDRPALHVALRAPEGERIEVDGEDVVPEVHGCWTGWRRFAERGPLAASGRGTRASGSATS